MELLEIINDLVVIAFDLLMFMKLISLKRDCFFSRAIMYGGCALIIISYFAAVYRYQVAASLATVSIMTVPSLILFFCLSRHKDSRFFLTFCFVDTVSLIIAFIGRCLGIWAGEAGQVLSIIVIVSIYLAIFRAGREYFRKYHELLDVLEAGWRSMTVATVIIYFVLIFIAAYPRPMVERLEYIPVYLAVSVMIISCYVVFVMSIIKTQKIHDQNKYLQYEKKLYQLAYEDALTGLLNRASYVECVQKVMSGEGKADLYCIAFDMNGLKNINDTKGHAMGDRALKAVAESLAAVFTGYESKIFRIGGDEFIVFLKNTESLDIQAVLAQLDSHLERQGKELGTSLSAAAGWCFLPAEEHMRIEKALEQADKEMYAVKKKMKEKIV
ncbi:diguanylate cyclase (GGDEF)-like protein [Cuneatibacter caecimuris]|uniref:Diguanylate cyclase (GGDEF)-like protein n=2 Tax=Cuneatibacter caecimuris TaxID=1796618 RepID=A0A4Q7PPY3_9FIRM|nr:diguanylate cyclase (GGDEF)-like protein [Cuneatibacter caecimuris]